MDRSGFIKNCNAWAEKGIPFLFLIDYEMEQFELVPLERAADEGIFFEVNGRSNVRHTASDPGTFNKRSADHGATIFSPNAPESFRFELSPVPFERYETAFHLVQENIHHG